MPGNFHKLHPPLKSHVCAGPPQWRPLTKRTPHKQRQVCTDVKHATHCNWLVSTDKACHVSRLLGHQHDSITNCANHIYWIVSPDTLTFPYHENPLSFSNVTANAICIAVCKHKLKSGHEKRHIMSTASLPMFTDALCHGMLFSAIAKNLRCTKSTLSSELRW